MSDFLNDVGKRISDVIDDLSKKTDKAVAIQGLKLKKRNAERTIQEQYVELGKIVYEKFCEGSVTVAEEAVPFCEIIKKQEKVIEDLNEEIAMSKGEQEENA